MLLFWYIVVGGVCMKKLMFVVGLFILLYPNSCYGETLVSSSLTSDFDAATDVSSRYGRKKVLDGQTTKVKKKQQEIFLEFPFDNDPYVFFSNFVLGSPENIYSGFIETIYYRDNIKIKDMYYENKPVQTDKTGIYSTDICFTSEEGIIYHYKNVPYLVSNDKPMVFFSEVTFDEEHNRITGEIKMPLSKNTYQIELFYTDNEDYHYQEAAADENGMFTINLSRLGQVGHMYLRAGDGLGNYADACDILKTGKTTFKISAESLKAIKESNQELSPKSNYRSLFKLITTSLFIVIVSALFLLRLRVIIRRKLKSKKRFR